MTVDIEFTLPDWASALYPIVERLHDEKTRGDFNPFVRLHEPRSMDPKDIKDWIRKIGAETNTTPTELANQADLAPSTINKFMVDDEGIRNLNARTLNKIKKAAADFLSKRARDDEFYIENEYGVAKDGALPLIDSNPYYLRQIKVVGGIYDNSVYHCEELQMEEARMYDIVVPVGRRFIGNTLCALQLNISESEEYYKYQDIIVCSPIWKNKDKISEGDRLIAVSRDNVAGLCRMSIRDLVADPKGHCWLISPYKVRDKVPPIYAGRQDKVGLPDGVAALFLVAGSYHQR